MGTDLRSEARADFISWKNAIEINYNVKIMVNYADISDDSPLSTDSVHTF